VATVLFFSENKLIKLANLMRFMLCFVWRIGGLPPLVYATAFSDELFWFSLENNDLSQ